MSEHRPAPTASAPIIDNNVETGVNNEGPPQEPKRSSWQIWKPRVLLISAVFLPVFLETLDYTVVATSQSNIASVFNRLDLQSYIGTAYVLGSTVFLPLFASLADVYGRYWAMQASVVFFLVGSAICTGAGSMPALLIGRGISGIGAAGLLTIVRIILSDSASLDDNNAQGALMVVVYTVGYSLGPVLGGLLLHANWRWVFAINLPVAVVSVLIMALILPKITKGPQPPQRLSRLPPHLQSVLESQTPSGPLGKLLRLDMIGALLFVILGVLILLGLNWGSTEAWDQPKVIACLAVGGFLLLVFIAWEYIVDHSTDHMIYSEKYNHTTDVESADATVTGTPQEKGGAPQREVGVRARFARLTPKFARITDPMIPMNMFRSYDVIATSWATAASGMVMLGIFYFVAIFYVIVQGRDPVGSGVQLLYFAPGIGLGVIISIRMIKRIRQPRSAIILANVLLPVGIGLLSQAMYTGNQGQIIGFMVMTGAGVGMGFGPLSYQARFSQPEDRTAIVVATNLFFRTAGGVVGLAQLSAVMYSRVRTFIYDAVFSGRITPLQALQISQALSSVGGTEAGGILSLPDALRQVVTDAFRDGLRWAFISLLPWLGIAFVLCLFLPLVPDERLNQVPGLTPKEQQERQEAERKAAREAAQAQTQA